MNPDHKKYNGPHGKCEGVKRRKYNCELRKHSQFGQNTSRERHEYAVKSGMESIRKGYIYISALLFPTYKYIYIYIYIYIWDSGTDTALTGTGTTYAKRSSGQSVLVPH